MDSWEDHEEQSASPSAEAPVFTPAFNLNAASFTPSFNAATFVPGQGSGYGAPPAGGYGGYGGQPQVGYGGYGGYGGQAQAGHGGFDGSNDAVSPAKAAADAQAAAEQEAAAKAAKEKKAKEKAAQDAEAKAQADAAKAAKEKAAAEKAAWDAKKAEEKAEKAKVDEAKDAEAEKARLDELRKTMEKREHLNIIFIGHVDAGKSTIGGHLMFLTGGVDARTLEKYEREAAAANRESWYLSWALDTNDEERAKGKTVECGKAHFTTEKKHFTIIDAPGHKSFVPSMIGGAAQADIAILVISARTGEFEAGFERGGQTREHAMLVKSAGVKHIVVVVNKMDSVDWAESRFLEVKQKLEPFLKGVGYNPKKDVHFMPISGQKGYGLLEKIPDGVCSFYDGPSLVQYLDALPTIVRHIELPLRMPVSDKYSDMGSIAMGKLLSGSVKNGDKLILMPNNAKATVSDLLIDDIAADTAVAGDNVKIKLKGVEESDLMPGYVLCPVTKPCNVATVFDAQLAIIDYKSIIAPGFTCMIHIHNVIEEITFKIMICEVNKKTGKPDKEKARPKFMKEKQVCIVRLEVMGAVCLELFKDNPNMGRFTLRLEDKTIGIGKVVKIVDNKALGVDSGGGK